MIRAKETEKDRNRACSRGCDPTARKQEKWKNRAENEKQDRKQETRPRKQETETRKSQDGTRLESVPYAVTECSWSSRQRPQKAGRNDRGASIGKKESNLYHIDRHVGGSNNLRYYTSWSPPSIAQCSGSSRLDCTRSLRRTLRFLPGGLRFFLRVIQVLLRALVVVLWGVVILRMAGIGGFLHLWHIPLLLLHFSAVSIAIGEMEFYPSRAASSSGCVGRTEKPFTRYWGGGRLTAPSAGRLTTPSVCESSCSSGGTGSRGRFAERSAEPADRLLGGILLAGRSIQSALGAFFSISLIRNQCLATELSSPSKKNFHR
ncbi:hypothetical protein DFP73DRAFT_525533 [Morchella snyderi]|nr:hypothetical protein DFP73DRAFT_525533 [Morchella snyderi]